MATVPQVPTLTPAARAILDAAGDLFYDRGINAVGVDTVAAAAGTTKKTLYDQFGSKAALAVAYLSERDLNYRAWVELSVGQHSGTERILAVFDALDSWMGANSPKGCPFVHAHSELLGSPEHPAHDVIRGHKVWAREMLADLAREEGAESPDPLAVQLTSLLEGAAVLRSISEIPDAVAASRRAAALLIEDQIVGHRSTGAYGSGMPGRRVVALLEELRDGGDLRLQIDRQDQRREEHQDERGHPFVVPHRNAGVVPGAGQSQELSAGDVGDDQ